MSKPFCRSSRDTTARSGMRGSGMSPASAWSASLLRRRASRAGRVVGAREVGVRRRIPRVDVDPVEDPGETVGAHPEHAVEPVAAVGSEDLARVGRRDRVRGVGADDAEPHERVANRSGSASSASERLSL
jgi:hypothetical protein